MTSRKSLILLLLLGSWPATAEAYCRTRTCDVDNSCEAGDDFCSVGGKAAYWPNRCLTFAIQRDGSKQQDISSRDALEVVEDAFALWTNSECHRGGSPPLTFLAQGEVSCHVPEFNCDPKDWNANVIMFQDEGWPHGGALAVTCVTMNLDTGEILDADMELNTAPETWDFALPGDSEGTDLHRVITHEAGHFLGLNHSMLDGAVMFGGHKPNVLLSSLSDDDIAGICDIYGGKASDPQCKAPELPSDTDCVGASECVPIVTEGEGCSCREGAPTPSGGGAALFGLLAGVAAIAARRRLV